MNFNFVVCRSISFIPSKVQKRYWGEEDLFVQYLRVGGLSNVVEKTLGSLYVRLAIFYKTSHISCGKELERGSLNVGEYYGCKTLYVRECNSRDIMQLYILSVDLQRSLYSFCMKWINAEG